VLMTSAFNIDETLDMAIRIEQNGRAFYLHMAQLYPDHSEFLNYLADEEIGHQQTFRELRKKYALEGAPSINDPDGLAQMYLASIADSVIFQPVEKLEELYAGRERIEQILEDAISREQDSVNFFTGIRKVLTDEKQLEGIEEIIEEEMTHIGMLMSKRKELEAQAIQTAEGTVFDLIIIGAGPGGVSLAAEAIEGGMDKRKILLLEQAGRNSWIIRRLYPEQKLVTANYKGADPECVGVMKMRNMSKTDILDMLNSTIIDYDVQVLHEMKVHTVEKHQDLFTISAGDHVFKSRLCAIGIGVFGKPNQPDYKIPAPLRKRIQFDVTSSRLVGTDVLVVGGGDSSAEYARVLLEEGNQVTLASREGDLCYMNDENRAQTLELANAGKLTLLKPVNISGLEEAEDLIKINFVDDAASITTDRIVFALGGTTPMNFLSVTGVNVVDGEAQIDEWAETNVEGLFLLGDLAAKKKAGAIVAAFNTSNRIVERMADKKAQFFNK